MLTRLQPCAPPMLGSRQPTACQRSSLCCTATPPALSCWPCRRCHTLRRPASDSLQRNAWRASASRTQTAPHEDVHLEECRVGNHKWVALQSRQVEHLSALSTVDESIRRAYTTGGCLYPGTRRASASVTNAQTHRRLYRRTCSAHSSTSSRTCRQTSSACNHATAPVDSIAVTQTNDAPFAQVDVEVTRHWWARANRCFVVEVGARLDHVARHRQSLLSISEFGEAVA